MRKEEREYAPRVDVNLPIYYNLAMGRDHESSNHYWTDLPFPRSGGRGAIRVRVNPDYVDELPTFRTLDRWVQLGERRVGQLTAAGHELDRLMPFGVEDCDRHGQEFDGDGHRTVEDAIEHAVCSLLDGGDPPHWVEVSKVETYYDNDGPFPLLTLRLLDGRIVRQLEDATCTWLVRVPSGNPEPDSPADCWRIVECGRPVYSLGGPGDEFDHTTCEAGHVRHAYGSPEQQAEERVEAEAERWGLNPEEVRW